LVQRSCLAVVTGIGVLQKIRGPGVLREVMVGVRVLVEELRRNYWLTEAFVASIHACQNLPCFVIRNLFEQLLAGAGLSVCSRTARESYGSRPS
jgi:hypothetical protein